jgi:hypothetical protein
MDKTERWITITIGAITFGFLAYMITYIAIYGSVTVVTSGVI